MRGIASVLLLGGTGNWLLRLGGPGLIVIGLVDNSVIPIPGGMDLFVILLSAHHREWWWYYGLMGTVGAVVGAMYLPTVGKGRQGRNGEEVRKGTSREGLQEIRERWILDHCHWLDHPPPFPLVPVLMAAGIMRYPKKKFLAALTLGRGVRFFAIAVLGKLYGTAILGWFGRYYKPFLYVLIALGVCWEGWPRFGTSSGIVQGTATAEKSNPKLLV